MLTNLYRISAMICVIAFVPWSIYLMLTNGLDAALPYFTVTLCSSMLSLLLREKRS